MSEHINLINTDPLGNNRTAIWLNPADIELVGEISSKKAVVVQFTNKNRVAFPIDSSGSSLVYDYSLKSGSTYRLILSNTILEDQLYSNVFIALDKISTISASVLSPYDIAITLKSGYTLYYDNEETINEFIEQLYG